MRHVRKSLAIPVLALMVAGWLPSGPALAGSGTTGAFPDLPWGAEGAVMGAGGVASVSDPTAVFWNPARLLAVDQRSFTAGTGDLYGEGLVYHSFASLNFPHRSREIGFDETGMVVQRPAELRSAFGLAADILTLDADGDAYRETRLALSYAFRSLGSSSVGFTLKYLSVSGDIDALKASGYDLDLGLDTPLCRRIRGSLVLRHALNKLSWDEASSERLNFRLAGGLVVRYRPQISFPLGVVWDPEGVGIQELSAGAGVAPRGDFLRLLAGLRYRPEDEQELLVSGGVSISWKRLTAGYGFTAEEAGLGATHRFNFGIQF